MKLLIVEDEPLIARRLERQTRELLGERAESVRVARSYSAAEAMLAEHAVDVLLLDLNLEGRDGMDLLHRAVAGSFYTIIVSANTDRAIDAFAHGVLDFVPKPFTRERLAQAFARLDSPRASGGTTTRYLAIRKSGRIELVRTDDVLYARGSGAYSELVLSNGRTELHDKTLERLERLLPSDFVRIHKSYLVRLSQLKALHAYEGSRYEAVLKDGTTTLPVGRLRYKQLKSLWRDE